MVQFAADRLAEPFPCKEKSVLDPLVIEAVRWQTGKSDADIIALRKDAVRAIESEAAQLAESGATLAWFMGADPLVQEVAKEVNGPLLARLAERSGFHDLEAVEVFREGADFHGPLACTGNGVPVEHVTCGET
jgi:hypothetical protein